MAADVRDYINPLIKKIKKAGLEPPDECRRDSTSIKEWFEYLAKLRKDYY